MSIVVLGASHLSAPLPLLEQLAIPAGETAAVLTNLKRSVREAMVLSTCNRTELYAVTGHAASGWEILLRTLADRLGTTPEALRPHTYAYCEEDAVRHALSVASGLQSMVLGEDQIQAQWKRALAHARIADALGPVLDRLGASALSCGKRVRSFTGIGRHAVSLESLAVRAVAERLGGGDLTGRAVLVIGSGDSASLVVRHLLADARPRITVMSRSHEKAMAFAEAAEVSSAPVDDIAAHVARADAIFCCTAAPHPVLGCAHFDERLTRSAPEPLVCVDLGMPRDIEAAVASVPGVQVIAMTELAALADRHREQRRSHVPAADAIVASEVARFTEWRASRGGAAAIARLHAHAREVAELELDVALARLGHLPVRDREVVATLARRIVSKLLHAPSVALKAHPEADNIALALEYAFGLRGAADSLHDALPGTPAADDAAAHIKETA